MILAALVWLAVAGLAGIGAGAIVAPGALAALYGAPVRDASAIVYVRAAGIRDVLLAAILAFAHMTADAPMVTLTCAAGSVLALSDLVLTLGASGWRVRREHLSHVAGFVGFAVVAYLSLRR